VTTGNLDKAVQRNVERFPEDFMFQLSKEEADSLRFQSGILKRGQHSKYLPYAFTEQGVSMLSAVTNSPVAIDISIRIMRAFVKLRSILADNDALRYAVEGLERRAGKEARYKNFISTFIFYLFTETLNRGTSSTCISPSFFIFTSTT